MRKHVFFPGIMLLMIIGVVLSVGLVSCGSDQQAENKPAEATARQSNPGSASAGVTFAAYDVNGDLHQSSEWVGQKPVVLNFWGTWCPPCRKEIPDLVKLYEEYSVKGIEIVGLAVKDSPDRVAQYSQQAGMKWPMLMADPNIMTSLKATSGVPTTIFLDKTGKEIGRFVGMRDYDTFKSAFDALLETSAEQG
jgi:thiol-disulfide isomerase/thioredoxin